MKLEKAGIVTPLNDKPQPRSQDPLSYLGTVDIEDITRWREDMNFMLEWQEQYLTSERSERVRYC